MSMRRRDTLSFMLAFSAAPLAAQAQQAGKVYRIAWISGASYAATPMWPDFVRGMRELGWIEGQHFTVEHLPYEGYSERLPALAAEAVQRKVDLISKLVQPHERQAASTAWPEKRREPSA